MPGPGATLAKAKLIEMVVEGETMRCPAPTTTSAPEGERATGGDGNGHQVVVQFNPETLKVNYANQNAGGEQASGGPRQFVGTSTTKLSVELVFDVSHAPEPGVRDVRALTTRIAYFMRPRQEAGQETPMLPPVCFSWGDFQFDGVMDSLDETLELFSADGRALRAVVSLTMSKQEIIAFEGGTGAGGAGTERVRALPEGQPLQQAMALAGDSDWQSTALASGIENTRLVPRGTLLRRGAPSRESLRRMGVA